MQIEELFRDEKNARFGWSFGAITVASNDPSRAAALIAIVALGVVAMTLLGLTIEARELHGRFQANTIRRRRVLSLFVLGTLAAASGECLPTPTELLQALATLRSNAWNFPS
jgi:cytochrome c biogenesis protein CcdA